MDIQIGQRYGFFDKDGLEGVCRVESITDEHVVLFNVDEDGDIAICQRPRFDTEVKNRVWDLFS